MNLKDRLNRQLASRKADHSFRMLSLNDNLIDFTSNDYLGLSRSAELIQIIKAREIHSNGATGSRLLSGNAAYTERVEKKLADIFHSEKALIFNSGYTANIAVLSSLPQRGDTILYDELSHASIKDGARLSPAKKYSFKHNDIADLENKLKKACGNIFIAVESVYSMDGDFCPLADVVNLSNQYRAYIILDEAHTTGIIGTKGTGLSGEMGLEDKLLIRIYTFGKGMGVHGAAISCNKLLADYLINFARPFIYTTALTPHSIASIECAFDYLISHQELQHSLRERINYFNQLFDQKIGRKLSNISNDHPIQAILIRGNDAANAAAQHLQASGYDVRPILSPTVKEGEERLRICLHTFNTDNDISGLIDSLATLV